MHQFRFISICLLILLSKSVSAELPCTGEIGLGYDSFKNLAGGNWEGNTGTFISLNSGYLFSCLCSDEEVIGLQLGGSYGIYNWNDRLLGDYHDQDLIYQQGFLTAGFFKKTIRNKEFNCGIVFDAMWNKNYGLLAQNPFLMQIRYQCGYVYNDCHEFGFWGAAKLDKTLEKRHAWVYYRSLSQFHAFWKRTFCNQAEAMIWAGIPLDKHIVYSDDLSGIFILGGSFKAPLNSRLDIEGHANYMHGNQYGDHREYAANVCIELKWSFGQESKCSAPYLPVANNSNFMIDSSITFNE